jgi:hypothetical protein
MFAGLASSCSPTAMLASAESSPPGQFGKTLIDALESRRLQDVISRMDPASMTPDAEARLSAMANLLPPTGEGKTHLVGYRSNQMVGAGTDYQLTFETSYGDRHFLTGMTMYLEGANLTLRGLQIQPIPNSLAKLNEFTLAGRGGRHYLFLIGLAACPLISIAAVVRWAQCRRELRRKWLWLACVLLGIGKFGLNWTTGEISVSLLQLQLLSAGFQREGAEGAWWFFLSLPIGALVFLFRKPAIVATDALSGGGA